MYFHFLGLEIYIPGVVAVLGVMLAYWIIATAKPGAGMKRIVAAILVFVILLGGSVYLAIRFPSDKEHRQMMGPAPAPKP